MDECESVIFGKTNVYSTRLIFTMEMLERILPRSIFEFLILSKYVIIFKRKNAKR